VKQPFAETGLLLCAAAWIATAAGCGSSVYGEKFQHRLEELQISSEFSVLREPTDDLPINFRFPQLFTKEFNRISADPENANKRILLSKFVPSFLPEFPGLRLMLQGEYATESFSLRSPVYLYVGEGDPATVKGKFPYEQWRDLIKRARFAPGAWEPVEVQNPKGKKLSWMRLIAKGRFAYDQERNRQPVTSSVDTFFQMWVYEPKEAPQVLAVLGWWSTEEVRAPSDIEKLAQLTAGTAVVSPAAAAPPPPTPPAKPK
jgi:hypothetical protein